MHSRCLIRLLVLFLFKAKPLGAEELLVANTNRIDFEKAEKKASLENLMDPSLLIQLVTLLYIKQ